jgi:hypothetical protein
MFILDPFFSFSFPFLFIWIFYSNFGFSGFRIFGYGEFLFSFLFLFFSSFIVGFNQILKILNFKKYFFQLHMYL